MDRPQDGARLDEWFVPGFGPLRFRIAVGLLFLPYTGMVLAFTVIGSVLADTVHWDRVAALVAIYFLALGIGAHALDAVGSRGTKPWGSVFSRRQLWLVAASSIALAYAIAIPYMLRDAPMLWWIAAAEGLFLLAYNLEWFRGRFHTDGWFALAWGALPVGAGHILQTNRLSWAALLVASAAALLALVEIKASRPYKLLKRATGLEPPSARERICQQQFESILKAVSLGVMLLGAGLAAWRWPG
ncbi:hypothetical protein PE066_05515 [Ramlibacter tataouinensis]|uniref:hypothetical protein n=1 Tax=Ramlibacter tataouinensis TaxID=94132 RepID=UPI0022F3F7D3|nr:hypothetical protein [Ramlibacter tataouinensis]WBY02994.1 hypothetical protein PE066_05515 [Ramlibacter tataouinensis]